MMRKCSYLPALVLLLSLSLPACSGEGGSSNNGGSADTGAPADTAAPEDTDLNDTVDTDSVDSGDSELDAPADEEAPEYRSIQASIQGQFSSQVDLSSSDQTRIVPIEVTIEFTIFATDDETDAEQLTVEIVDADGTPFDAEPTFSNGLWKLQTTLSPGGDRVCTHDGRGGQCRHLRVRAHPSYARRSDGRRLGAALLQPQ